MPYPKYSNYLQTAVVRLSSSGERDRLAELGLPMKTGPHTHELQRNRISALQVPTQRNLAAALGLSRRRSARYSYCSAAD